MKQKHGCVNRGKNIYKVEQIIATANNMKGITESTYIISSKHTKKVIYMIEVL